MFGVLVRVVLVFFKAVCMILIVLFVCLVFFLVLIAVLWEIVKIVFLIGFIIVL